MYLGLLSRKRLNYSNRRFREEAKELGHKIKVVDPADYEIALGRPSPVLFRDGKPERKLDVVIPRLGASITGYGLAVVSQFEAMGVPLLNDSSASIRDFPGSCRHQ